MLVPRAHLVSPNGYPNRLLRKSGLCLEQGQRISSDAAGLAQFDPYTSACPRGTAGARSLLDSGGPREGGWRGPSVTPDLCRDTHTDPAGLHTPSLMPRD